MAKYEYVAGMSPGAMSNDVFPFRYTDILMMKAECLLRTGKADEAAQNCNRNQTTRIQVCSGKSGSHWCGTDGREYL